MTNLRLSSHRHQYRGGGEQPCGDRKSLDDVDGSESWGSVHPVSVAELTPGSACLLLVDSQSLLG